MRGPHHVHHNEKWTRNLEIARARVANESFAEIARRYGLSPARVRIIYLRTMPRLLQLGEAAMSGPIEQLDFTKSCRSGQLPSSALGDERRI